jgi:glycosyltransferase involved in cell wall biosynthesis
MKQPFLSVIIPAHNEETRILNTVSQLQSFFDSKSYSYEVLIIENGSTDNTYDIGKTLTEKMEGFNIISIDEAGKGIAVKHGISLTTGKYRLIADSDFSMPVEEIEKFIPPVTDCEINIGSREVQGAVRYNEPPIRHFIGRVFNLMVRIILFPDLKDTQCGFKCFRGDIADEIFPYQSLKGWAFDVEVLQIARLHGWKIKEIPINWYYFPGSKVNVFRDSLKMFLDLIRIKIMTQRKIYETKKEVTR